MADTHFIEDRAFQDANASASDKVKVKLVDNGDDTYSAAVSVVNFPAVQPVSAASLPLPTGAATNAAVTAITTALGSPAQAGGTVSVSNFPGSQAVTGPITDAQLRAAAVPVSGTFFQATQPVSIAASVAVTGPVTDAQLRASAVPVSLASTTVTGSVAVTGTFFQATQPVSASALPLPSGASTEATLALIKAKTDNLDVALSTRAVTGLTDAQLRASVVPVSLASTTVTGSVAVTGPLTDTQLRASAIPITELPANACVTATGASGAAVTLTLPAPGASLKQCVVSLEVTAYNAVARVGGGTPVLVTTTNLPGTPTLTFASAGAIGTTDRYLLNIPDGFQATTANTAVTVVCPATTSVIWRVTAIYRNAA